MLMVSVSGNNRAGLIQDMAILGHLRGLCVHELHDGLFTCLSSVCDETVLASVIFEVGYISFNIRYDIHVPNDSFSTQSPIMTPTDKV